MSNFSPFRILRIFKKSFVQIENSGRFENRCFFEVSAPKISPCLLNILPVRTLLKSELCILILRPLFVLFKDALDFGLQSFTKQIWHLFPSFRSFFKFSDFIFFQFLILGGNQNAILQNKAINGGSKIYASNTLRRRNLFL